MSVNDNVSVAVFVFVAALLQVTLIASIDIVGGSADVLLLALVAIALLRGAVTGAVAGFFLALFETGTAKMRVFRVPQFLGAALMLGLLGTLLLFVSKSF